MGDELTRMRERLATRVIAANHIGSDLVADALWTVPRHLFLPDLPPAVAYRDDAIVTKRDADGLAISSSSQPGIMAIMLDQLDLAPGHRVLEIGAGTGYNAALMRHIVGPSGRVVSVEIDRDLTDLARWHLASAGYPDVTVVWADGAEGYAAHAPYDRLIATVGVSDLAPAWLAQVTPEARIVVPLDVGGTQLSVAFGRSGGHWASRSLAPCGFIRMRGRLAGPEHTVVIQPGLVLRIPAWREIYPAALAVALAGPGSEHPTGVRTGPAQVFFGLSLWLTIHEPRLCLLYEERPGGLPRSPPRPASRVAPRLGRAPLIGPESWATVGILDADSMALLTTSWPAAEWGQGMARPTPSFMLTAAGFGPRAAGLAADLAAHVRAWHQAGQPDTQGLHVDAYPKADAPAGAEALAAAFGPGAMITDRPGTWFVVYRVPSPPAGTKS
ncbi:MAG TPA: methyltransferase, FxLD system [Streptosporangiaceae bacterium]|nr:methyltransferase, FxLD system [Streptosporangiaceae bacterium]